MSLFRDLLIEKKRRKYYCEVEYLESTGTQYIYAGIDSWNNTLEFETKVSIHPSQGIRHNKTMNVAFADGHAGSLSLQELNRKTADNARYYYFFSKKK